jgi:hypothetical protein
LDEAENDACERSLSTVAFVSKNKNDSSRIESIKMELLLWLDLEPSPA